MKEKLGQINTMKRSRPKNYDYYHHNHIGNFYNNRDQVCLLVKGMLSVTRPQ